MNFLQMSIKYSTCICTAENRASTSKLIIRRLHAPCTEYCRSYSKLYHRFSTVLANFSPVLHRPDADPPESTQRAAKCWTSDSGSTHENSKKLAHTRARFTLLQQEKSRGSVRMGELFQPSPDRFCRLGRPQQFYRSRSPHVKEYFRVPG